MERKQLFSCETDFDFESRRFNQTGRATIYILARVLSRLPEGVRKETVAYLEGEFKKIPDVITEKFPFADQREVKEVVGRIVRHLREK